MATSQTAPKTEGFTGADKTEQADSSSRCDSTSNTSPTVGSNLQTGSLKLVRMLHYSSGKDGYDFLFHSEQNKKNKRCDVL